MTERYPEQKYFTIIDASRFIGRSAAALRHLVSRRQIRHFRSHDGRIQLAREDLEAFVQAEVVEPQAEVATSVNVGAKRPKAHPSSDGVAELKLMIRETKKRK